MLWYNCIIVFNLYRSYTATYFDWLMLWYNCLIVCNLYRSYTATCFDWLAAITRMHIVLLTYRPLRRIRSQNLHEINFSKYGLQKT